MRNTIRPGILIIWSGPHGYPDVQMRVLGTWLQSHEFFPPTPLSLSSYASFAEEARMQAVFVLSVCTVYAPLH